MPLYLAPTRWPRTDRQCADAFGHGTWSSAWDLDQPSGAVADLIGSLTLNPVSSPTFQQPGPPGDRRIVGLSSQRLWVPQAENDYSVLFDGATDSLSGSNGATYDITTTGQVAVYACMRHNITVTSYAFGKESATKFWLMAVDTGKARITAYDGVTSFASQIDVEHGDNEWHDYLAIVDRTGGVLKLVTDLGVGPDTNISAALTLTNPSNAFQIGRSSTNQIHTSFVAVASGASVTAIRANAVDVIRNIRRYSGRG